jgi:hypothetical protein
MLTVVFLRYGWISDSAHFIGALEGQHVSIAR